MTVKKFLELSTCIIQLNADYDYQTLRPRVLCEDGYTISVQAGRGIYCEPYANLKDGNYTAVELGYPNRADDLILEYAECPECPTGSVYGRVPVSVVETLCRKHGGIVGVDISNMILADASPIALKMLDNLNREFRKNCTLHNDEE